MSHERYRVILTAPGPDEGLYATFITPDHVEDDLLDTILTLRSKQAAANLRDMGADPDRSQWRVVAYDVPPPANSDGSGQKWLPRRQPMIEALVAWLLGIVPRGD